LKTEADLPIELWQSISAIYRTAVKRLNSRLSEDKISFSQFSMLRAIGKFGPMPMNKLGDHMLVAPANITGLVDRLERKGYVERRRDRNDRRLLKIELTERGRRIHDKVIEQFWTYVRNVFSSLSENERMVLLGLLARIRKSVDQIETLE
jgi:MarR family 2-MHQ and catechol resistance regulon transcriptional repressor